ncbi:MAG TPA: thioredoxin family protein [Firmicutes bacterium]|nr:thioredoxin family protein [Bacillota bacterium]
MDIKVLGSGCARCNDLEGRVKEALAELGLAVEVTKVTDFREIMKYGVMQTPALVVDGQVKVAGRIPNKPELIALLSGKK